MGFPQRSALDTPAIDVNRLPRAINPVLIWVLRMFLTLGVCGLSIAVLVVSCLVVKWYNDHEPIVKPSWGSLIFLIVLGVLTPVIYFVYDVLIPLAPFIHPGDILYSLLDVKVELCLQFAMAVLWVSGTLAYFEDLGGKQACQFDSYYHYAQPDDFDHVCNVRDLVWKLCWATFGLQALLFLIELVLALYIFLFQDQEVLNEPHYTWGRRAYDFQKERRRTQKSERAARAAQGPIPVDDGFHPDDYDGHRPQGPYYDRYHPYEESYVDDDDFVRDPYDRRTLTDLPDERSSYRSRDPIRRSRDPARRGRDYEAGTPAEASSQSPYYDEHDQDHDEEYHEAGPFVGHDEYHDRSSFASNHERGYTDQPTYDGLHHDHDEQNDAPTPTSYTDHPQGISSARSARSARTRSDHSSVPSLRGSHRRTNTLTSNRRGRSYASYGQLGDQSDEEQDLPALGSRGRRAYADESSDSDSNATPYPSKRSAR